jgi:hypothetical protein
VSIIELTPWKAITPFGTATVRWLSDDNEQNWGVVQHTTGEIWWWKNNEIRWAQDITGGINKPTSIYLSDERKEALKVHMIRHGTWK